MNYKLLILFALVASVLLSGCVENKLQINEVKIPVDNQTVILHKIMTTEQGNNIYVFNTTVDSRSYTCFYTVGGGVQSNPALSCTNP